MCAAVLAVGCGSSGSSTTSAPAIQSSDLKRLKPVPDATGEPPQSSGDRDAFLRHVFDNAQAMWQREFERASVTFRPARLTIFTEEVETECGTHGANVGPFYCVASSGVYLDPSFFASLSRHVGVHIGDFAQAYVVAHEVAHHVQTLLGLTRQKALADQRDPTGKNDRSIRFELQADCFAGVWAHSAYRQGAVSPADILDALNTAAVVGDDFQSRAAGGRRPPEEWTHGTSAQRQQWFTTGFTKGDPAACDTFSG
jgi:predicted metalloprotease